jgi:hypothetical protein
MIHSESDGRDRRKVVDVRYPLVSALLPLDVFEPSSSWLGSPAYTTRIACSDGSAGYGTSLSGITVNPLDNVTCTVTNTSKLFRA